MYALLILDMQIGLVHGPDRPWGGEALLETLNTLMRTAREDVEANLASALVNLDPSLEKS